MRRPLFPLLLLCALLAEPGQSRAQAPPEASPISDDADPLGLGDTLSLAQVPLEARPLPTRPPAPRAGEILGAAPSVREVEHRTHVRWIALEARVEELWRFRNTGSFAAELRYRQALPEGARLAAMSVCIAEHCRQATARADSYEAARARPFLAESAPIGGVHVLDDAQGHAAVVRAAPVPAHGELTVHLEWSVDAPLHGGLMQLSLPARGTDPRAASALVTAEAEGLGSVTVEGGPGDRPAQVEPWFSARIEARGVGGGEPQLTASVRPCAEGRCLELRGWAPPARAPPRDVVLALDVSPSTSWPRTLAALTSLLTRAPRRSRFLLLAFAARARALSSEWQTADEVPLTALSDARDRGLGPATRFDEAVRLALPYLHATHARATLFVLVSDGRLMGAERTAMAFAELRDARVPVSLLNVGSDDTPTELEREIVRSGGRVILAGDRAEQASRGRLNTGLDERVRGLFARRVGWARGHVGDASARRALYAGDSLEITLGGSGRARASFGGRALRVVSRRDAAPEDASGQVAADEESGAQPEGAPLALAPPEPSPARPGPRLGRGVPAQTVLTLLRTRLVPAARACFRRDRAGREDYAVRAEFRFRLERREVVEASLMGQLPDALRGCLLESLFTLEVPSFRGAVIVHYPLHTVRIGPGMTLELLPEVAREVDELIEEPERLTSRRQPQ